MFSVGSAPGPSSAAPCVRGCISLSHSFADGSGQGTGIISLDLLKAFTARPRTR